MTEIKMKLKTPRVPNFIHIDSMSIGKRQEGFQEMPTVSIADLSDEMLESLAEDWKKELLATAKRIRETRN